MLTSGDVVNLELADPPAERPATATRPSSSPLTVLDADPSVLQVVPLTSTLRRFHSEIVIDPDDTNGLIVTSAAQCQHIRSVARERVLDARGNVGARCWPGSETIAIILDLP